MRGSCGTRTSVFQRTLDEVVGGDVVHAQVEEPQARRKQGGAESKHTQEEHARRDGTADHDGGGGSDIRGGG